jgi:hypothetical protein
VSPFKEPQPRKNSAADDAKKVIGGVWPPYSRTGDEARWQEPKPAVSEKPVDELASALTPLMALPDYSPFELRKAALEAACAVQGNQPPATFWSNITTLEEYLKDGTKPS